MKCAKLESQLPTGYQLYSQVYHLFYTQHKDTLFLERIYSPLWRNVLEVGVGQGRLVPFFLEHGVENFTGIDISSEMLERIPAEYQRTGQTRFVHDDFLEYGTNQKFDFILYAYNSFNYILSQEDAYRHLQQCCRYLKPNGTIFLDLTFPNCLRNGIGSKSRLQAEENGRAYEIMIEHGYDMQQQQEQRLFTCDVYDCVSEQRQKVDTVQWISNRRFYTIEDILSLARSMGLSPINMEMYLSEDGKYYDGFFIILKRNAY